MSGDPNPHESLLQFLYMAPIGLVQTDQAGQIDLINPMAVQLLMPLLPDGDLDNLFTSLRQQMPDLQQRVLAYPEPSGVVCDSLRFSLPALDSGPPREAQTPRILALSLLKLGADQLIACLSDVTTLALHEQTRLDDSLKKAARTDALTGLPNRAAAHELIEQTIEETSQRPGAAFAVLLLNCDRFNRVNTTYGQHMGDDLIRAIATRLVSMNASGLDKADRAASAPLVTRLGNDEFAILIHQPVNCRQVLDDAQTLADALSLPYQLSGHQIHTSVSIGLCYSHADNQLNAEPLSADGVLEDASIAMREAKRAGGGRCHLFVEQMRAQAEKRGTLENRLRLAIEQEELSVEFQPIVNLQQPARIGVEALVRWNSPELGIMPPAEFIGIAEETGLIVPLGLFVLRRACAQFSAWRLHSPNDAPAKLSVNLSRAQLLDDKLTDQVAQILADNRLPSGCLQLEVTESLAAQSEIVCERLARLKEMGVSIALDDFGTGYSSLSSLHQLPVDTVKIDQSFVRQLETSQHHRVLVEATVMVAQSLGMNTVAEGIETQQQANRLRALKCDKGQGYLFSRPMPAAQVAQWIRAWQQKTSSQALPKRQAKA